MTSRFNILFQARTFRAEYEKITTLLDLASLDNVLE